MSDTTPEVLDTTVVDHGDELTSLKAKADLMGITYHPSIGVDKLRAKVVAALSDEPAPEEDEEEDESAEPTPEELVEEAPVVSSIPKPTAQVAAEVKEAPAVSAPAPVAPVVPLTPQQKVAAARDAARTEALRMVRINVTCMNPLKSEYDGEIFTVGNNLIGTVSKFVPFGTTEGWHVPNIIYLMIKERQFQQFSAPKGVKTTRPTARVTKLVREFSIEVLDPLTEQELKELKQRQLMAKGQE